MKGGRALARFDTVAALEDQISTMMGLTRRSAAVDMEWMGGIDSEIHKKILRMVAATGDARFSATAVGKSEEWLEQELAENPKFAAAYKTATEIVPLRLEWKAYQLAVHGTRKKLYNRSGDPVIDPRTGKQAVEHKTHDRLMMFMLKAMRPDKYKSDTNNYRVNIRASGKNAFIINDELRALAADPEIARLMDELRNRASKMSVESGDGAGAAKVRHGPALTHDEHADSGSPAQGGDEVADRSAAPTREVVDVQRADPVVLPDAVASS